MAFKPLPIRAPRVSRDIQNYKEDMAQIERVLRELAGTVNQTQVQAVGGRSGNTVIDNSKVTIVGADNYQSVQCSKGEVGIVPKKLLHVTSSGVAYLARADRLDRRCTHVCVSLSGGSVIAAKGVMTDFFCQPGTFSHEPILYLSTLPGFATPVAPVDQTGGALIQQPVGNAVKLPTSGGVCRGTVEPGGVIEL